MSPVGDKEFGTMPRQPAPLRHDLTNIDEIALAIAATGLSVFPCTKSKRPVISKTDGGHGFLDAATDPERVRDLFSRPGVALVGVPTGQVSGFDVLDFDYRHGAAEWEAANRHRLPRTRAHKSLSGGTHLLFLHAPGVRNLASKFARGMDVRGEGGYVIFPPSTGYSIIDDAPVAEWPVWLLSLILRAPAERRPAPSSAPLPPNSPRIGAYVGAVLTRVRSAPNGAKRFTVRNAALTLGGLQHQSGHTDGQITAMLLSALPRSVRDWNVARDTIAWAIERGRERPIILEDRFGRLNSELLPLEAEPPSELDDTTGCRNRPHRSSERREHRG
jgi:hypothetical protein